MLDIKFIRENIDLVREAVESRQDSAPLDEILQLDSERRQKVLELEGLRHDRKEAAREREVGKEAIEKGREIRARIRALEEEVRSLDKRLEELLLQVPNIPHSSVPVGKDEADNAIVRSWGELPGFDFQPAPPLEIR